VAISEPVLLGFLERRRARFYPIVPLNSMPDMDTLISIDPSCPALCGHPRILAVAIEAVDGRDKPGHDRIRFETELK
jgi:hypothetical protein